MAEGSQLVTEVAVSASVWLSLLTAILGALVGTLFGAVGVSYFSGSGVRRVRKLCCNTLDLLREKGIYSSSAEVFNKNLARPEKRAILVCLHKLGVPITNLSGRFDIDNVKFLAEEVVKDDVDLMKVQVEKGMCDTYFFMDVDDYFNKNIRLSSIRAVAKRFVGEVMVNQRLSECGKIIVFVSGWFESFTPGELNVLQVFKEIVANDSYFDLRTKLPNEESLKRLKEEIDLGLWDIYLQWDYAAYKNMIAQRSMAETANTIMIQQSKTQAVSP